MKNFILYLCGFPESGGKHGLAKYRLEKARNTLSDAKKYIK